MIDDIINCIIEHERNRGFKVKFYAPIVYPYLVEIFDKNTQAYICSIYFCPEYLCVSSQILLDVLFLGDSREYSKPDLLQGIDNDIAICVERCQKRTANINLAPCIKHLEMKL